MSFSKILRQKTLWVCFFVASLLCAVNGQTTSTPTAKPSKKPTNKPVHIYGDEEPVMLSMNEKQGVVAALTILLFILMALDFTGPEVLFLIALMILCLAQILTLSETLSGFSNESMITIGTLFLVIGAVEKSHVVDWLARKTFGTGGSDTVGKLRMYISCFLLSIFFNNTPLVAILLPVVKDWGRMRGMAASQLLIPLSYSVLAGSFGSMIGTSTNLTVQGLMQADRGYSFPFFAPLPIGLVCFAILLVYMIIAGPFLLPTDKSGLLRQARDELKEYIAEVYVSQHSPSVGCSLSDMMASLGVAQSFAVKIRRRNKPFDPESPSADHSDSTTVEGTLPKSKSANSLVDLNYLQDTASFWYSGKSIPEKLEKNGTHIGSDYFDIISPSAHEVIAAGDVVFIASAQDAVEKMLKSIMGESKGLYILQSNVMSLPGFGSELIELVVSDVNPFVDCKVSDIAHDFAEKYKAAIITVRGKDFGHSLLAEANKSDSGSDSASVSRNDIPYSAINNNSAVDETGVQLTDMTDTQIETEREGSSEEEALTAKAKLLHTSVVVSDHVLRYGDTLLAVTSKKNVAELSHNRDFFVASTVGALPKPLDWYTFIPVIVFVTMLVIVATSLIEMCPAALTVTAFFFMGGWIKPKEIPQLVDIRLLMLMGCSLSFAKAMTSSGLAIRIASTIRDANPSPFGALLLIYAITLVITELISNNAAAALMYPIGVALADEMDMSFQSAAMAVLVASTAGFMSPIGYQTHVMVWAPGGYSFRDFVIFGIVPDIIYWIVGCALITVLFPA